jgi:ribonuclease HII
VIRERAVAWSVAFAEPEEIDVYNIYWAGLLAMHRATLGLVPPAEHVLVDGRTIPRLAVPQDRIVHGDALSLSIAAASILAKTARDARMVELDALHPGFGFAQHKGYPVPEHLDRLARRGACAIHRRSFAPVREALGLPPLPPWPDPSEGPPW